MLSVEPALLYDVLIAFAVLLGLVGSYISVRKHIRAIEPNAD